MLHFFLRQNGSLFTWRANLHLFITPSRLSYKCWHQNGAPQRAELWTTKWLEYESHLGSLSFFSEVIRSFLHCVSTVMQHAKWSYKSQIRNLSCILLEYSRTHYWECNEKLFPFWYSHWVLTVQVILGEVAYLTSCKVLWTGTHSWCILGRKPSIKGIHLNNDIFLRFDIYSKLVKYVISQQDKTFIYTFV